MTKKYKNNYILCKTLSILMTLVPYIVYTIKGFCEGTPGSKATLGVCFTTALIFTIINVVFKYHMRSTIWILMIGLYVAVDNIIPLLIISAIATILDEFILSPLARHYKSKYVINKEIDKRIPNEPLNVNNDSKRHNKEVVNGR